MGILVDEGLAAENIDKVVQALAASLQVAGLPANALGRVHVLVPVKPVGLQRSVSSQRRRDVVERNVLAVEVAIDVLPDLDGLGRIRRVVVEVGNVGEAQVGEHHGVLVLALLVGAKVVVPLAILALDGAAGESADQAELAKLAPGLEDPFEVIGLVVDVVVGEQDGLGLKLGIRDELLVQAVFRRHPVAHFDAVLRDIIGGRFLVQIVPDNDNLVQRGDVLGENGLQGALEFLWSVVGLHCDT